MSSAYGHIGVLRIKLSQPGDIPVEDLLVELDNAFERYNLDYVTIRMDMKEYKFEFQQDGTYLVEVPREDDQDDDQEDDQDNDHDIKLDLKIIKLLIEHYGFEVVAEEPYPAPQK